LNQNSAVPIFKSLVYLSGKRTMYVGPLKNLLEQSNSLTTLILSIDKELRLIDNNSGQNYISKSFLIPAGSHVTVDTNESIIALCFLDTLGTDLAKLIPSMDQCVHIEDNSTCYSGIPNELAVIEQVREIFKQRPSAEDVFERLDGWIESSNAGNLCLPDARISMAIGLIAADYARNVSIDEIASAVELSVPRLIQLFKQVTGIPIRRFRLCHRIFVTLLNLSAGMSLTDAVVEAGFSDYSHFSRIFKELGGIKPSELLSSRNLVDLRRLSKPVSSRIVPIHRNNACAVL
jgi:AraC-like DNA-binding protein